MEKREPWFFRLIRPISLFLLFTTPLLTQTCAAAPAREVVIVVNGLNAHSAVLAPLSRFFENNGLDVTYVPLPGQSDNAEEWEEKRDWTAPFADKFGELSLAYDRVHILGYSIGGVATLLAVTQQQDRTKLGNIVLIAPPLATRANVALIRLLTPLRLLGLALPSFSPQELRIHDTVPLAIYHTALELIDRAAQIPSSALKTLPVVCIIAPKDEIVSAGKVRRWVIERHLPWSVLDVTSLEPRTYNHLFVHPSAHSQNGWMRFRDSVLRSLTASTTKTSTTRSP